MKTETIELRKLINFHTRQQEAFDALSKFKYLLYGGAMGGGKSYWLRWTLVWYLCRLTKKYNLRGIVGALFCEDYPSLKDRQISKMAKEFPSWLGDMHADHKEYGRCFIAKPLFGAWVICLRNLDDSSKYKSAEFAVIAIDELTKNSKDTFDDLKTRLRWSGIEDFDCKFISGTNPGEVGHAWVKKWWIDRDFEDEIDGSLFGFIQSKAEDNTHLDSGYLKTLDSLPDDKRKAYRDGDWDIFKGQFFQEFRRETHVIKPFAIPEYGKKIICGDYGFAKQSAVYWCYIDSDDNYIVYRELYKAGLTYEKLAEEIVSMTPDNEFIDYYVFDPAIWQRKGEDSDGFSGAEKMMMKIKELTKRTPPFIRGDNERILGWNLMREYLRPLLVNGKKQAKLQIFEQCYNLIRTLPGLVYDSNRVEDCDTDGEDHAPDSLRYGLMSRPKAYKIEINPIKRMLNSQNPKQKRSLIID